MHDAMIDSVRIRTTTVDLLLRHPTVDLQIATDHLLVLDTMVDLRLLLSDMADHLCPLLTETTVLHLLVPLSVLDLDSTALLVPTVVSLLLPFRRPFLQRYTGTTTDPLFPLSLRTIEVLTNNTKHHLLSLPHLQRSKNRVTGSNKRKRCKIY